ncbi:MAG TPA: hypothetical protein VEG27_03580 [Usitatibacter sp.]|nr:hypothetical protein [Usitatibacter sp.]
MERAIAPLAFVLAGMLLPLAALAAPGDAPPSGGKDSAAPGEAPTPARTEGSRFVDPEDGQLDLSDFLAAPRTFLPIPIVVTEPAVGYGGGIAAMFLRPRTEAGHEGWVRPNISMAAGFATENGTRGAFAGDSSRWIDARLRSLAGAGGGRVNLDFYGLGPGGASPDQKVRYSLRFGGALAQANWQLAPRSPWSAGLRYAYADVQPELRDAPAFPGLADRVHVKISAPTPILEYDSRDNIFTPTHGVYAESSLMASRAALGASADFERFDQILMGWTPLARGATLGARLDYSWSSDGTPFFLRPYVALRGVAAVRYQGDQVASTELELRVPVEGRWSAVVFGGAGRTWTRRDELSATRGVGSGGAGLRYELARKFGMHAGIDIARSAGTTAVYLQVGSAWFRP